MQLRRQCSVAEADALLVEALKVPAHLPAVSSLKDAVKRAKEWQGKAVAIHAKCQPDIPTTTDTSSSSSTTTTKMKFTRIVPVLEVVETLLHKARPIPLQLPELVVLEEVVAIAQNWRDRTARTFIKKNSHFSLMEVLVPRTEIGLVSSNKRKRVKKDDMTTLQQTAMLLDISIEDAADANLMVNSYRVSIIAARVCL